MKSNFYELIPIYDNAKSFYKKAYVEIIGSKKILYSYERKMCEIDNSNNYTLYGSNNTWDMNPFTQTTMRHIKEFLKQSDIDVNSSKEIFANCYDLIKCGKHSREKTA